ncbi:MAG: M3 family metallopeptidase, partial [Pseudomonadota bacterium]
MTNPLLADWSTPFELPPFDAISDDDFAPAFAAAMDAARAEVGRIAENTEAPTFANTVEALERSDEALSRLLGVFYNLNGADANEAREALARDFSPKLAAYGSEITMNRALFGRIETLWAAKDNLGLTEEQKRVLYLTRRGFVRAGAQLEGAARERLKAVKERLAVLGTQFTQNLLADERSWFMDLSEADLEGLPDFVVAAARAAGQEKGAAGPVVTLSRSLIVPFLQFSPLRELREKAYAAWTARGANGGETDNRAIAAEILSLREERARLLGYADFASYKLETEMAKTPSAVEDLLMQVWAPAKAQADRDAGVLTGMLQADGINGDLAPWDWRYYAEKRRKAEHDLDEAELKPYLQLDRMIEAAFACAARLFGLAFQPVDAPLYHSDVRAWEVTRDGKHLAVFLGDYFARGSKRSGAWCSAFRSQQKLAGDIRPIVVNVCNFAKPSEGQPALLSYDDARTLFHEFGHALHQMLSDVTYERISGTSVARDFVELPSQLYEHWLEVPEVLAEFATHAETGEAMPPAMLERLLAAQNFDQGFATVEYVASALVDLGFHRG